jgi:heptaprenyl diphosphate synthase
MDEARAYVLDLAREATAALSVLDDGPVKDALVAFADLIATRSA